MNLVPKYVFVVLIISMFFISLTILLLIYPLNKDVLSCGSGELVKWDYMGKPKDLCLYKTPCSFGDMSACSLQNTNCSPCTHILFNCSAYKGADVCVQVYEPVCGVIKKINNKKITYKLRDWGNACSACINNEGGEVIGYFNVSCSEI